MTQKERYESAKEIYAKHGVDTDAAIAKLKEIPVSLHCWQGDDVTGFDHDGPLTGGIQTTGNYPGKARTPEELMQDIDCVIKMTPGTKKLNLHASYAIFEEGEFVDRDKIEPKHFEKWVAFAKETGIPCVMNIWTGDGSKDIPAERLGPRERYKESIEEIIAEPHDPKLVKPCVESKVFGIGVESYTVGSAEFALSFAATHEGCLPLMDNGHYHPTEVVSDKIPALLAFFPEIALHITRPVRWDSDHVVLFDDETKEMAKEIVRCNAIDRVNMALDYFDASINRVSAWTVGFRSWQKSLLSALCTPAEELKKMQDESNWTKLMVAQEAVKMLPFGDIWAEYCAQCNTSEDAWFEEVMAYEKEVLSKRV